jgi:predicted dienelactone hydrolase
MRILEILIIIVLFILSIQFFLPSIIHNIEKNLLMGFLGLLELAFLLIHALIEGARWQMLPVYGIVIIFIIKSIFQLRNFVLTKKSALEVSEVATSGKRLAIGVFLITIVLVGTTSYLNYLLPVFVLPEPTGQYTIGTTTFDLTDSSRDETFTPTLSEYRRIFVRAWYPADEVTGQAPVPYVDHPIEFATGVQRSWGFPSIIVSHFPLVKTHSYLDVPLSTAESEYPVLFFSHGYGGIEFQNTVLMQELASHGYICFSINHPYESIVAVFSDGTVIYETDDNPHSSIADSLDIWAADTTFLLDQLNITDNPNIPDIFWGKLDFENIGVFGHSFGGTTAEELCLTDSRFDVGISFDSPHYGHVSEMNMTKPFMLLSGPDYGSRILNETDIVYANSENICYGLYVEGTRHHNFADVNLWSTLLKTVGLLGTIDGYRMLNILNSYVQAFFDKHIKNIDSVLLDGPSIDFPEVTFFRNDL